MDIIKLRRIENAPNGSKTVAFADVVTSDGVLFRSCRLAKFDSNYQIQPPSRQVTQKEKDKGFREDYVSTCKFTNLEAQADLLQKAIELYEKETAE